MREMPCLIIRTTTPRGGFSRLKSRLLTVTAHKQIAQIWKRHWPSGVFLPPSMLAVRFSGLYHSNILIIPNLGWRTGFRLQGEAV